MALGKVGHWGHSYARKNRYEANITVEPVEGVWKITGLGCWRKNELIFTHSQKRKPNANPKHEARISGEASQKDQFETIFNDRNSNDRNKIANIVPSCFGLNIW
jgi:hypothetical protein